MPAEDYSYALGCRSLAGLWDLISKVGVTEHLLILNFIVSGPVLHMDNHMNVEG
jgi:hypothetical protein